MSSTKWQPFYPDLLNVSMITFKKGIRCGCPVLYSNDLSIKATEWTRVTEWRFYIYIYIYIYIQIWSWSWRFVPRRRWSTISIGQYIDGLVQERRNSSALAVDLRLSCINPSICTLKSEQCVSTLTYTYSHNNCTRAGLTNISIGQLFQPLIWYWLVWNVSEMGYQSLVLLRQTGAVQYINQSINIGYPPKTRLKPKSREISFTSNFTVILSVWNLAQNTAVSLSCSLQIFKTIGKLKQMFWANEISRDLCSRWISDGYTYITQGHRE